MQFLATILLCCTASLVSAFQVSCPNKCGLAQEVARIRHQQGSVFRVGSPASSCCTSATVSASQRTVATVLASTLGGEDGDYTNQEIQDMRKVVLDLSLITSDDDRRQEVTNVLKEALARPNGMPKRFTDLFDQVLVKLGEEVQLEAKKKFFEKQAKEIAPPTPTDSDDEQQEDTKEKEKSPDELQLWALVDMMVQSKTIVKRESGELGSKGTFQ